MNLDFLLDGTRPTDLRQVAWPQKMTLLVTAPHPDDFDAISVTLRYMVSQGHTLYALVAETGSGIDKVYGAQMDAPMRRTHRNREQISSFRYFGLSAEKYRICGLENADDDQVADTPANRAFLAEQIQLIHPDMLFMPHGNDTNRAHRAMYAMAHAITDSLTWPIALMLNSDVKTVDMKKDFYLGFGVRDAIWKAGLLRCHDSQHQRNLRDRGYGFDARVLMLNKRTAMSLALAEPYAGSFELELNRH